MHDIFFGLSIFIMFGWHQTSPSSGRSSPRHTRHRSVIVPTSTGGSSSACWERYLSSSLLSVPVWNQNWFCLFWTMYFEWNESSTIHLELVQNYPFRVWRFSAKPFISCFCSPGGVAWASVELLGSTAPVFLSYGLEWFESIFLYPQQSGDFPHPNSFRLYCTFFIRFLFQVDSDFHIPTPS